MTTKPQREGDEEILESRLKPQEIIELCKKRTITHFYHNGTVRLSAEGIIAIAPFLFTSSLKYLDISCNFIGPSGGLAIAEALKKCTSLTFLNLEYNSLGKSGGEGADPILDTLATCNVPLTTLDISYNGFIKCKALARLVSKSTTLTSLNVGVQEIQPFFQALKSNSTLRDLIVVIKGGHQDGAAIEDCFEENSTIISGRGYGLSRGIMINNLCKRLKATDSERRSIPKQMHKREEIEGFLKELIQNGEQWNAGKLIFLGNGEVGKTALLNSIHAVQENIKNKNKWFFQWAAEWLLTSRTVGIDQSILVLKDGEISVWDFGGQMEYTVTHQFFLSNEMVVILVCYDLSQPAHVQLQQLSYWLDFLQSALPPSPSSSAKSKWKVIIVGTKRDLCVTPPIDRANLLRSWQVKWSGLPIHDVHFSISSKTLAGVDTLLGSLEITFDSIFKVHALRIPKSFKSILHSLQSIPEQQSMNTISDLFQQHANGVGQSRFVLALKYLHAIGRIVILKGDSVCTAPKIIPNLVAKFISPEEVHMKLAVVGRVEILHEDQLGTVLNIFDDANRVREIKLLEYIGVCFKLSGENPTYLLPSLSSKTNSISFSIDNASHFHLAGTRFTCPQGLIFVPGFFCQFIVSLFETLNISKRELNKVHSNCIAVSCQGLFVGELIVTIEYDAKSIVALIRAINPDISFVSNIFYRLARNHGVQYQSSSKEILCPTCIDLSYFQSKFPHDEIGTIAPAPIKQVSEVEYAQAAPTYKDQFCKPKMHIIESFQIPLQRGTKLIIDVTICWSHNLSVHDFFISYRVITEGRKASSLSTVENEFGLVEVIYLKLAAMKKKDGQSVFVFWDKKCLNYGQNWEDGFLYGLKSSKVILLLVSIKLIEGIANNAPNRQDNVLYEYAILQNEIHGKPVIPIFAAEMTNDGKFAKFDCAKAAALLHDVPHKRKSSTQKVIGKLSEDHPDTAFLGSIKQTVEKEYNSPREEKAPKRWRASLTWQ